MSVVHLEFVTFFLNAIYCVNFPEKCNGMWKFSKPSNEILERYIDINKTIELEELTLLNTFMYAKANV